MHINQLIDEFLASNCRNKWLETVDIKVYVRKGWHLVDGKLLKTFDLASVIIPEDRQGCGIFRDLMLYLESLGLPIYVESIINKKLAGMLKKHGYTFYLDNAWKICR